MLYYLLVSTAERGSGADLSKFMAMLQVKELQRQLDADSTPILVMAAHPGFVNSDGVQAYARSAGPVLSWIYSLIAKLLFVPASKGAYSSVFAAAAPNVRAEPAKYGGAYIIPPGKLGSSTAQADDPELAKELWETADRILCELEI